MTPLVDPSLLQRMRLDFGGDETTPHRFVTDFLALWNDRELRLRTALASDDLEEAHVVLLSIRSSSQMLGAIRLEITASRLHAAVKDRDLGGYQQHLTGLSAIAADTCLELTRHIRR